MTLQRILGAAALTLVITAAYAVTANEPGDTASAQSSSSATAHSASAPAVDHGG